MDIGFKYTIILIFAALILLNFSFAEAFSPHKRRPVTPYGDFCPECSKYGKCRDMMGSYDAKKAMKKYYHRKGYDVEIDDIQGRFIKAKIKEKGKIIDVIIFDRQTGRIRSIY